MVVSKPFLEDGGPSPRYALLSLSPTGQLTETGVTFSMHPSFSGHIAFTPDGALGFVAQDDGSLGVFALFSDGGVEVRDAGSGAFYARQVAVSSDGSRVYVIDDDTLNNGGGLYAVDLACDGTLGAPVKLGTFNTPDAFAFLNQHPEQIVVAGGAALDSGAQDDFHGVDLSSGDALPLGSTTLWATHDALPSAVAVMADDGYALVADDGYAAGSRIAVARLGPSGPSAVDVLSTPNPADVVASPFGNAALVLNSDGQDALTRLAYDPSNTAHPFALAGPLSYVTSHPQLPAEAIVITRGSLTGRVLVGELSGVRQVQFWPDAGISDLSLYATGGGLTDIVGALGVQP